jgi:uncharacterized membrane protein (GlpM family)
VSPTLHLDALRTTRPSELVVRFVFGGSMTAMTGLIAHAWGPAIGGLFLAFPAILPASLTLVASHEGREIAACEARGAILGAIALGVFAIACALLAPRGSLVLMLAVATAAWIATSTMLWWLFHGSRGRA